MRLYAGLRGTRASARAPRTVARRTRRLNEDLLGAFEDGAAAPSGTVCMFVRNTFEHDARVIREIEALTDRGMAVVVVAAAPTADAVGLVEEDRYTVVRVFHQATSVRLLLDGMLEFKRGYWKTSRRVWKVLKWPFRATGLFLANKVARPLALSKTSRLSPSTRRAVVAAIRRVSRASLSIVTIRSGRPPLGIAPINAIRRQTHQMLWPLHRLLAAGYFVRMCARMGASLRPVAYHCHDQNTVLAGQLARRRAPAFVIYDAHELYPHRNRPNPRAWKGRLFEIADRFSSRRSDAVITVNQSIAGHMTRRYGLDHVDVVMNIPDVGASASRRNGEVLDLEGIPRPRLFYCGNITFNRGIEESVQALVELPECSLVVVGQARGTYADDLRNLAASLGVADRLHIFPPVPHEDVVRVAAQADVGLVMIKPSCLSYEYALPNKLFECLHAGLPVVASDLPELRRIVSGEGVGLVCDHDDPSSIAEAVKAIVGSSDVAEGMRQAAVRAAGTHTWDREREHLLSVYRRLGLLPNADEEAAPTGIRRVAPPSGARRSVMPTPVSDDAGSPAPMLEPEIPALLPEADVPPPASPRAEREALRRAGLAQLHRAIHSHLPRGARVAVVSRGDDELLELEGYELGHFPQGDDGGWSGYHPEDDEAALTALEIVGRRRFEFLAFPSTAHWWLDHYLKFRAHLEEAEVVTSSDDCTIFRIRPRTGRPDSLTAT